MEKNARTIVIDMADLENYFADSSGIEFVCRIKINTLRYIELFSKIIDKNMKIINIELKDILSGSQTTALCHWQQSLQNVSPRFDRNY